MDLNKLFGRRPSAPVHAMARRRNDLITGAAAKARPDINEMGPRVFPVLNQHHHTAGVPRRERRPALVATASYNRKLRRRKAAA